MRVIIVDYVDVSIGDIIERGAVDLDITGVLEICRGRLLSAGSILTRVIWRRHL